MLANQLARAACACCIIDRHSGPAQQTRRIGVQAPHAGDLRQARHRPTRRWRSASAARRELWAQGRLTARIPSATCGKAMSPFPFIFMLGQDDNERIMGEQLRELGVDVQWNTELVGLEQQRDMVDATLKQPDGTSALVRAAWVGGLRRRAQRGARADGIDFPGAPYEHVFFVADIEATGDMVPTSSTSTCGRTAFHLFFPMRGKDHWRVVGILPPELRGRDDSTSRT
jgi:2-polyprenyl-6-methoxyphenol hydroxylase-like FAD-dependent oxidoreductase